MRRTLLKFVHSADASANALGTSFTVPSGAGEVMQADQNAAVNILARLHDKELHRWLPFQKVKQILLERCRRPDETAHPEL
jgi:hypothetical protein